MSNVYHEFVLFRILMINISKYMTTKFVECCRRIFNVSIHSGHPKHAMIDQCFTQGCLELMEIFVEFIEGQQMSVTITGRYFGITHSVIL